MAVSSKENSWKELSKTLFTIEGDEKYLSCIEKMFRDMGNRTRTISAENKTKYHAAARMVQTGDKIILMAYTQVTPEEAKGLRPTVLFVDDANKVTKVTNYEKHGEIA